MHDTANFGIANRPLIKLPLCQKFQQRLIYSFGNTETSYVKYQSLKVKFQRLSMLGND